MEQEFEGYLHKYKRYADPKNKW